MKKNIAVGQMVDLDISINGGPVDESVIYELAPGAQAVLSINTAGNVVGMNPGTGILYIRNPVTMKIVKKIVFSVYTPEQLQIKKDIASGVAVVTETTNSSPVLPVGVGLISPTGMTANTGTEFKVYGSGSSPSPYTVFNGSAGEVVCWQAPTPGVVGYKGQTEKIALTYGIMPNAGAYAHMVPSAPSDFKLQGTSTWVSDADMLDPTSANWTTLDEQTGQFFTAGNEKTFSILFPQAFKHYRLVVTKSNAPDGVFAIKELRLFGYPDHLLTPWNVAGPVYNGVPGDQYIEAGGYTIYDNNTYYPSSPAWNALDSDTSVDFWTRYAAWMIFKGSAKKVITRFEVTAALDPNNEIPTWGSKAPGAFRLQGTNNWVDVADAREFSSANWNAVAYFDNQTFTPGQTKTFTVEAGAPAYKHYRLLMSNSPNVNEWIAVSGVKLYGVDMQDETLLSPWGVWDYASHGSNVWYPATRDEQNHVYADGGGYRIYSLDDNWYSPYGPGYFALDNNTTTECYSRYGASIILKSQTSAQKIVTRFEVAVPLDPNNYWSLYGSDAPSILTLQATNDWLSVEDAKYYSSTNWTTLAQFTSVSFTPGETKSFDVPVTSSYTHFRLVAGGSAQINEWTKISEFKLYGFVPEN